MIPPSDGTAPRAPVLVRRPAFAQCLAAIRRPEIYRNFGVHLFVMLPAGMAMCWVATRVDRALGLEPLGSNPALPLLGAACIGLGGFWVWYVYGYLLLAGGGSPGTHVDGGPVVLVDSGPYTVFRHPSVLGKLLAVIGLGVLWKSPAFLVGFMPVLLLYAVLTGRFLQERFCDQRFGQRYQLYRERVPMLVPRPDGIARWWRGEAALPEQDEQPHQQPPGIATEFHGYLVGLAVLLSLFAAVWALADQTG
jgi:protein-S-isoprenylcysteine O-methyltransferase Ste14